MGAFWGSVGLHTASPGLRPPPGWRGDDPPPRGLSDSWFSAPARGVGRAQFARGCPLPPAPKDGPGSSLRAAQRCCALPLTSPPWGRGGHRAASVAGVLGGPRAVASAPPPPAGGSVRANCSPAAPTPRRGGSRAWPGVGRERGVCSWRGCYITPEPVVRVVSRAGRVLA